MPDVSTIYGMPDLERIDLTMWGPTISAQWETTDAPPEGYTVTDAIPTDLPWRKVQTLLVAPHNGSDMLRVSLPEAAMLRELLNEAYERGLMGEPAAL